MSKIGKLFKLASCVAIKTRQTNDLFGAIGIRKDGVMVTSINIRNFDKDYKSHAETRLSKKLDVGSLVIVVRISKKTGKLTMAKPCPHCEKSLRQVGVSECYYSIDGDGYGVIEF